MILEHKGKRPAIHSSARIAPNATICGEVSNMLVCTGGRQRSEAEFRSLYAATGFALSRIIPTDMSFASIIEGVPE
jgi:hypothetical protein